MFEGILKRPVLAIVISIFLVFVGILSIFQLPVSQFPQISPTQINIFLAYPGASADVLVKSTLIHLETELNGVPGMRYMVSDATNAGEATIQIVFEPGIHPNDAMVRVKTRVDQAMPLLPPLVQREGVFITPLQPSMLMYLTLYSTDSAYDEKFLNNYAYTQVLPEIQRIPGVAAVDLLGTRTYAMRIWLNPDRMRAYKVSVEEVMEALAKQSLIGRPGRLGLSSGIEAQSKEYILIYQGWYNEPQQYENVIIRSRENGLLRLKDIAKVELGSEFYDIYNRLDQYPAASMAIKQTYESNAQEVIERIKERMKSIEKRFPPGIHYEYSYDVSRFLSASIEQVLHTLRDAFILVTIVVFIFLGDWRATLIPMLSVPVSLIGTFFFMRLFGLSINLITLFSLVLAIGLVVDNSIVIIEAVHAKIEEGEKSVYEATRKVLKELSPAVIAITLVMSSVFIPITFMTGPVGVFYREFGITMASSILLSGVIALTTTPVLVAILLKAESYYLKATSPIGWFLVQFKRYFSRLTKRYTQTLSYLTPKPYLIFLVLFVTVLGIAVIIPYIPGGFIPNEDQGFIYAIIQTPPGSTLERTFQISLELQERAKSIKEVESVLALAGYEIMTEGRGSTDGTCLIKLKDWSERERTVWEVMEELEEKTRDLSAIIEFFEPPAIPGYGSSGGFSLRLLDQTQEQDYIVFDKIVKQFMKELRKRKELTSLFTFYAANYPQYELILDPKLAMQKGVSIEKAMENLNILIGSTYEQGFVRFGRFYKVYVQAAPEFRRYPSDLLNLFVKNEEGEMVPYSAFMTLRKTQGPNELTRYNMYNSAVIRGLPARGYTTGDAIKVIQEVAKQTLPKGYDIAWEGLSYDEARRGNEALYIFLVVIFFVYLILAAQYESFVIPLSVFFSLVTGLFGAFLALKIAGLANDVYSQLALIMLVGILGKNAILIVEYGIQNTREGKPLLEAAIEGGRERFRPILMTSFAFIVGLIPLVIATGPGAIGNRTLGTATFGGMLIGTVFGVFITPGLYYFFAKLVHGKKLIQDQTDETIIEAALKASQRTITLQRQIRRLKTLLRYWQRKWNVNEKKKKNDEEN